MAENRVRIPQCGGGLRGFRRKNVAPRLLRAEMRLAAVRVRRPANFHAQVRRVSGAKVAGIPKIMHKTRGKIDADVCGIVTFTELYVRILRLLKMVK